MSNSRRRSDQFHYNYPSFSSSLLEEIYRSFDDDSERDNSSHHSDSATVNGYKKFRYNKNNCYAKNSFVEREKSDEKFRVNRYVLDQWMIENNINKNQKVYHRRNSMNSTVSSVAKLNSSSSTSSSDSASSGTFGFSYSDSDSQHGSWKSRNPTLKPIKTAVIEQEYHRKSSSDDVTTKNKKKSNSSNKDRNHQKEGNLQKRALKLYGDLKKVKQPISPGGKFATFLNSLFNSTTPKKPKISASSPLSSSSSLSQMSKSNATSYTTSTPSTASSYSRSCLSKTPSSTGKFERRSVRFCPVSTVMAYSDEREHDVDLISEKASINDELKVQMMEKHRRVEEVAKELLKNYHHHHNGGKFQNEINVNLNNKKINNNNNMISSFEDEDEDEDDDDDASCCSSDLFELDNLLEIGGDQRYCEELPVYETTHVHTNRAIAKGFIL